MWGGVPEVWSLIASISFWAWVEATDGKEKGPGDNKEAGGPDIPYDLLVIYIDCLRNKFYDKNSD